MNTWSRGKNKYQYFTNKTKGVTLYKVDGSWTRGLRDEPEAFKSLKEAFTKLNLG
jgi:hypothetical protein